MFKRLVFGIGLMAACAVAAPAQVMTDMTGYMQQTGPQPMPQVSAAPGVGQPYFDDGQCNSGCNESCPQCVDCCRYIKTFGGFTELDSYENANGAFEVEGTFQEGFSFGGALGRKIAPAINVEVEFTYRNNEGDEWSVFNPQTQTTTTQPWDGDITCYSGMTNFLLECCRRPGQCTPYGGAGAGFGFVDASLSTATTDYTIDDAGFAFQYIAGVSKAVSCNADVFVEYRYFAVEDLVVDQQVLTQPPSSVPSGDFDYRTHNVLFGIRLCH